jgi:hypothetical protein
MIDHDAQLFIDGRACHSLAEGSVAFEALLPVVRRAVPRGHFMWSNIYCLSEYWTDRFPREPRQQVEPSERCDYERDGKQEHPQRSHHNQGTLTAAVRQHNATSTLT